MSETTNRPKLISCLKTRQSNLHPNQILMICLPKGNMSSRGCNFTLNKECQNYTMPIRVISVTRRRGFFKCCPLAVKTFCPSPQKIGQSRLKSQPNSLNKTLQKLPRCAKSRFHKEVLHLHSDPIVIFSSLTVCSKSFDSFKSKYLISEQLSYATPKFVYDISSRSGHTGLQLSNKIQSVRYYDLNSTKARVQIRNRRLMPSGKNQRSVLTSKTLKIKFL